MKLIAGLLSLFGITFIVKCDGCPMNESHWNFGEAEFTCNYLNKVLAKSNSYRLGKKYPGCKLRIIF